MLLRYFLEKVHLVLHGGHDQVVLPFLVVLRFLLYVATRPLGRLWPLVVLLVIMFDLAIVFSFAHLCSFEVPGCYNWFPSPAVFASNHRKFQIVSFIHFWIFRSLSNRCSRQSFLVSRLLKYNEKKKDVKSLTFRHSKLLFYYKVFPSINKIITFSTNHHFEVLHSIIFHQTSHHTLSLSPSENSKK